MNSKKTHTSVVQQRANVKLSNSAFKVVQGFADLVFLESFAHDFGPR